MLWIAEPVTRVCPDPSPKSDPCPISPAIEPVGRVLSTPRKFTRLRLVLVERKSALWQFSGRRTKPLMRGADEQRGRDDSLGLGLYIANEIAKAHQGAIEVRSDDAETVFAVTLPRRRQEAPRTRNG